MASRVHPRFGMTPRPNFPPTSVLVSTDFGEPSKRAVEIAIEMALEFDAALTIVHSVELPTFAMLDAGYTSVDVIAGVEAGASAALAQTLRDARKKCPRAEAILRRGSPWQEILAAIDEARADLVVMATHGRRGISRALIGSVAERVVRLSPVPVLTIRTESEAT
jgi:nucleotide-binding universal stress UspA family protein